MDYSKLSDIEINGRVLHAITNGKAIRLQQASVDSGETDYCNNPADAWPILLSIIGFGVTISIDVNSINGESLGGKSITRKIAELYLGLQSD